MRHKSCLARWACFTAAARTFDVHMCLVQVFLVILVILVHDAIILLAGFALANNALTLNLEGGLVVKKRSVAMVPKGGGVTVGSGTFLAT